MEPISERSFREAQRLFQQGQHEDALAIFSRLSAQHPDNPDVLYGCAACLVALDRTDAAQDACNRLAIVFADPRGDQLLARMGKPASGGIPGAPARARGGLWRSLLAAAVAIPLTIVTLDVGLSLRKPPEAQPAPAPAEDPVVMVDTKLRVLAVDGNPVNDESVAALRTLNGIENLQLDQTMVGDEGLEDLGTLSTLREVSVRGTRVTDDGVQKLKAAVPGVTIIR